MKALFALLQLAPLIASTTHPHVIPTADHQGSHEAHIRRVEVDHTGWGQIELGSPNLSAEFVQEKSRHSKDEFVPPPSAPTFDDRFAYAQRQLHMHSFLGGIVVGLLIAIIVASVMSSCTSLGNKSEKRRSAREATAGNTQSADAGRDKKPAEAAGRATEGGNRDEAYMALSSEYGPAENLHLFWPRCGWLAAMLLIQSISSFILSRFQSLVDSHDDLIFFLTMLVGLGGNAGGQSVVLAVRKLAKGERDISVPEQVQVGFLLGCVLGPLAFLRSFLSGSSVQVCLTIGLSAGIVVMVAAGIGTAVPKALNMFKSDPGQASSMIQVLMDIIGISVVCGLGVLILR